MSEEQLDALQHIVNTQLNGIAGMLEMMQHTDLDAEQRAMLALAQDTTEKLMTQTRQLLQPESAEAGSAAFQQISSAARTMLIGASDTSSSVLQELQRLGVAVDNFTDTRNALAALSGAADGDRPYRVVFVEQRLQGLDGETLGTAIGTDLAYHDTLLVLLSDAHSAQDTDRLAEAGFTAWLPSRPPANMLRDTLDILYRWAADRTAPGFIAAGTAVEDAAGGLSAKALLFDGSRVLAIDDNPVNLHVIERMLARLGCQVDTAAGGELALNRAADHVYDLILMDCNMPGLDGHQTTALLRAAESGSRHTPIIGWSACTRSNERETCLATGMDDFLAKPTQPQALRRVLARWLPAPHSKAEMVETEDELEVMQQMFGSDFVELAQLFLSDTPQRIAALNTAIENRDTLSFARIAHALCGSSASIGASSLAALCRELEIRAKSGIAADAARMQPVEREYARIEDRLHAMMQSCAAEPARRMHR
jgi:CheY-like chemotaxis protein/HPt (histidine-containing phosphotransfer) domain-containing protein